MNLLNSLRSRLTHRPGDDHVAPLDDVFDSPDLDSLAHELGDLGRIDLAAAPRERTWALVRAEAEKQEMRGAFARRNVASGRLGRLALGGAALVAAVTLGVVGLTGGFNNPDQTADGSSTSGSVVADGGATTETQAPGTSGSVPSVTESTQGPTQTGSPATGPASTRPPVSNETTSPRSTAGGTQGTSVPSTSPVVHTNTTQSPGTTTTGGGAVMTSEQRESSARTLAMSLGDKIVTGNVSGALSLATPSARSDVVQMVASLDDPFSYRIVSSDVTRGGARVLMEMTGRVPDPDGEGFLEKAMRFYLSMQVDDGAMVITHISKAPAE